MRLLYILLENNNGIVTECQQCHIVVAIYFSWMFIDTLHLMPFLEGSLTPQPFSWNKGLTLFDIEQYISLKILLQHAKE